MRNRPLLIQRFTALRAKVLHIYPTCMLKAQLELWELQVVGSNPTAPTI